VKQLSQGERCDLGQGPSLISRVSACSVSVDIGYRSADTRSIRATNDEGSTTKSSGTWSDRSDRQNLLKLQPLRFHTYPLSLSLSLSLFPRHEERNIAHPIKSRKTLQNLARAFEKRENGGLSSWIVNLIIVHFSHLKLDRRSTLGSQTRSSFNSWIPSLIVSLNLEFYT